MSYTSDISADGSALASWRFAEIRSVPDILRYWGSRRPEKVALIEGRVTRTYAELDLRSNAIANRLIESGVARGSTIGYVGKNAVDFFEIWFGAGKAACAMAAFNWRCTVEELTGIIGDARPPVIFVSTEFVDTIKAVRARCDLGFEIVCFDSPNCSGDSVTAWIDDAATSFPNIPTFGADTVLVSYTSGTTGVPKGVMATQEAFGYSFLCGVLEPALGCREDDVLLMSMPNFHLAGSWVSLAALYAGAAVSIIPAFDPRDFLRALRNDSATVAPLVPAAIQLLLDHPEMKPEDFSTLRSILYFGSPIGADLMKRADEVLDCALQQFYGTTETWFLTILDHERHIPEYPARLVSCGTPLPLISIKIVDSSGEEVAPGTVGEVVVRTPMVFARYWQRPDATRDVLHEGWYRTGDLGRLEADGFLYLVDRAKDMIISGGENIYSTEVEKALQKLEGVQMCAVIGLPDAKWGEKVIALIVRQPSANLSEAAVIAHCRELIAGYKVPKQIKFVEVLPMTPTGKVKKGMLRKQFVGEAPK